MLICIFIEMKITILCIFSFMLTISKTAQAIDLNCSLASRKPIDVILSKGGENTDTRNKTVIVTSHINDGIIKRSNTHKGRQLFSSDSEYGEWKDDDELLNYDNEDDKELSLSQKLARNWKRVAIRFIFLCSFLFLILLCCRCWLATTCPFILSCVKRICCCWTDICCKCCQEDKDPIYERVKELAKNLGIEITEETYDHLLQMCEDQGMAGIKYIRRK